MPIRECTNMLLTRIIQVLRYKSVKLVIKLQHPKVTLITAKFYKVLSSLLQSSLTLSQLYVYETDIVLFLPMGALNKLS